MMVPGFKGAAPDMLINPKPRPAGGGMVSSHGPGSGAPPQVRPVPRMVTPPGPGNAPRPMAPRPAPPRTPPMAPPQVRPVPRGITPPGPGNAPPFPGGINPPGSMPPRPMSPRQFPGSGGFDPNGSPDPNAPIFDNWKGDPLGGGPLTVGPDGNATHGGMNFDTSFDPNQSDLFKILMMRKDGMRTQQGPGMGFQGLGFGGGNDFNNY